MWRSNFGMKGVNLGLTIYFSIICNLKFSHTCQCLSSDNISKITNTIYVSQIWLDLWYLEHICNFAGTLFRLEIAFWEVSIMMPQYRIPLIPIVSIPLFITAVGCATLGLTNLNNPYQGPYPESFQILLHENEMLGKELAKLPEISWRPSCDHGYSICIVSGERLHML